MSGAVEIRTAKSFAAGSAVRDRLRLLASDDGWSLVRPDGELLFRALGTRARHECLQFARAHGALAVFS